MVFKRPGISAWMAGTNTVVFHRHGGGVNIYQDIVAWRRPNSSGILFWNHDKTSCRGLMNPDSSQDQISGFGSGSCRTCLSCRNGLERHIFVTSDARVRPSQVPRGGNRKVIRDEDKSGQGSTRRIPALSVCIRGDDVVDWKRLIDVIFWKG